MRNITKRPTTGIQRYTLELLSWIPGIKTIDAPDRFKEGIYGHLWEQLILPRKVNGLLWSPSNTGPVVYSHQVVTIHDLAVLEHPEWFDQKFVAIYRCVLPALARRVRHILTDSEASRQRIIERLGVKSHKVTAVLLSADGKFSPVVDKVKEKIRERLALPDRFYLSVGSLEPRKNMRTLLRAWEVWDNRPAGLELIIAGGKGKVFSSIGFSQLPEGVKLIGRISDNDLPALYSAAEAFIYPSLYEGFGLPPLEAMSCGTPVITSNVTSLPEVVGDSALLIDPYREASLLQAMQRLSRDLVLHQELKEQGLARAKLFSWEKAAEQTYAVLEREI